MLMDCLRHVSFLSAHVCPSFHSLPTTVPVSQVVLSTAYDTVYRTGDALVLVIKLLVLLSFSAPKRQCSLIAVLPRGRAPQRQCA